ncbi:MAG: hypothetical protein R3C14_48365 [Caldilineaceae bacterium]
MPEASLPLQFMAGIGLGTVGLDTVTDLAALISGRDPLTGQALTPQDMFITWLAFSLPLVSATMLHGFADDAAEVLGGLSLYGKPAGASQIRGDKREAPIGLAGASSHLWTHPSQAIVGWNCFLCYNGFGH